MSEPVSVYVHVPFCRSKCRYCAFYSEPVDAHDIDAYLDALSAEIDNHPLPEGVCTVYIGGGSPTALGFEGLLRLVNKLTDAYSPVDEFTVEANPGQLDRELLTQLRLSGVNRLSLGAQSFDAAELELLGRMHSPADTIAAVENARLAGFDNIGLDLIFALPNSTVDSWRQTVITAIDTRCKHISAYALTWEEGTPLYLQRESGKIIAVDEETDRRMYETAIETITQADMVHYEISNFARQGYECRHNLRYWANEQYIGFGPAAASYYDGARSTNVADVAMYIERMRAGQSVIAESHTPSRAEIACETAVLNLRRTAGIDMTEYKKKTGYDLMGIFADEIRQNIDLGLLEIAGDNVRLTAKALPVADSVLSDFTSMD